MLTSRVERKITALEDLGAEWEGLLERAGARGPFLTRPWLLLWWRHYGGERPLFLVTVRDEEGRLVGGGFFYVGRRVLRHLPGLAWRELRLVGASEEVDSDYLQVPLDRLRGAEAWREILGALRSVSGEWDIMRLTNLLYPEKDLERLSEILRCESWLCGVALQPLNDCPEIELPADYEEYLAGLRPDFRQEVRRLRRRMEKRYAVRYRRAGEEGAPIEELLEPALALHGRWAMSRPWWDGERSKRFQLFFAEALRMAVEQRWLYLAVLELDGQPAGAVFNFLHRGMLYGFQKATDPSYAAAEVDKVLLGHCIEDAIRLGVRTFDFLQGGEEYKSRWTNRGKQNWIVSCRRRTLSGRLHQALSGLRSAVGRG